MNRLVLLIAIASFTLCGCSKKEEKKENLWPEPSIYNQSLIDSAFASILEKHPEEKKDNLKVERIYYGLDTGSIKASEFVDIRILQLDQRFLTKDRTEKHNSESTYYKLRFKLNGELERLSRAVYRLSLTNEEYDEALDLGFTIKEQ